MNQPAAGASFSEREFRDALGLFPTGVAIVTAVTASGERLGVTVSSFNSVSLSPPLVLFSVARKANSFAEWQRVRHYAVHVLNEEQGELSTRFARALSDKWDGITTLGKDSAAPLLPNALVALECAAHARFDGGDHEIFVGRVLALHMRREPTPHPLIFFRGRYRRLDRRSDSVPAGDALLLHGW